MISRNLVALANSWVFSCHHYPVKGEHRKIDIPWMNGHICLSGIHGYWSCQLQSIIPQNLSAVQRVLICFTAAPWENRQSSSANLRKWSGYECHSGSEPDPWRKLIIGKKTYWTRTPKEIKCMASIWEKLFHSDLLSSWWNVHIAHWNIYLAKKTVIKLFWSLQKRPPFNFGSHFHTKCSINSHNIL